MESSTGSVLVKTLWAGSRRHSRAVVVGAAVVVIGGRDSTIEVGLDTGATAQAPTTNAIAIVLWAVSVVLQR
jgi:hypothetical protein